jgi:hypothetical protein
MPRFRRPVLIAIGGLVAAGAVATLLFYTGPTQEFRDCVAILLDRKHPLQVRQRHVEQATKQCEKRRLISDAADKCDAAASQMRTSSPRL